MIRLKNTVIKNIFYLFFPLLCGSLIGLLISGSMDYGILNKPLLSPPGFIFPIVWSILYILMGISYYLYKNNGNNNINLIKTYYLQLFFNLAWSIFFFILKWRLFTIFWTIALLMLVIYLLYLFYQEYKTSTYLNIPYLIWLIFATYLTIGVYILN